MARTLIIGAGVVGCSVALELARRGTDAVVVDRHGDVGHGSTSASCGIVRHYYSTPTMTAMAQEGAGYWDEWAAYLGLSDDGDLARFDRCGMLFIPTAVDERVRGILDHMRALGVEAELLDADQVAARFPFLDPSSHFPVRRPEDDDFFEPTGRRIAGAVLEHDAGYVVSPQVATANLRRACEREGVEFRLGHPVTAIERTGAGESRFRLTLDDGNRLEGRVLVNVAGPHSALINRMAGVELPLETRALRRDVAVVENPVPEELRTSTPIIGDLDSGIYMRPESGGHDLVTGSLEPECDEEEWLDDPDAMDVHCSVEAFDRQVMRLMKRIPEARLGRRRGIASQYDVTLADWTPILDRTDAPGYYVAIGTSGSSFKTAPVIGVMMARLIEECEAGRDHDRDPLRLPLTHTDFEVDCAFFSRLRSGHATTSTVLS
jgi:sarcosine oxidase subunit beta